MVSQDYNAGELPVVKQGMSGAPTEQLPVAPVAEQKSPAALAQETLQDPVLTPYQKAERIGQLKFRLLGTVYEAAGVTD